MIELARMIGMMRVFLIAIAAMSLVSDHCLGAEGKTIDLRNLVVMINGTTPVGRPLQGAGLVIGRDADGRVLIVTAGHIVQDEFSGAYDITVRFFADDGRALAATLVKAKFNSFLDLAVIAVAADVATAAPELSGELAVGRLDEPMELAEEVTLIGQTGGQPWAKTPTAEKVALQTADQIVVVSRHGGPGMSGGIAIDASNRIFGIALTDDRSMITIMPLSVIAEQLRATGLPFVITEGERKVAEMDQTTAFDRLDRAKQLRDGSDLGQKAALSLLVRDGMDFRGNDLAGIDFSGAALKTIRAREARLWFTDFSGADLTGADFTGSGLRLASANKALFKDARLGGIYAPLLEAHDASFAGADLSLANLFGADLARSDFSGARLDGAVFAFADLRGASFRNAVINRAHFVGAMLDGADFTHATFVETNMLGARLDPQKLTAMQRQGTCQLPMSHSNWNRFEIVERWESSKYSSGYEYEQLDEWNADFSAPALTDSRLRVCAKGPHQENAFDPSYPLYITFHIDRQYLEKVSRRELAVARRQHLFDLLRDFGDSVFYTGP